MKKIYVIKEKNEWNFLIERNGSIISSIQGPHTEVALFINLKNFLNNFHPIEEKIQIISFGSSSSRKNLKSFYTNQDGLLFDEYFKPNGIDGLNAIKRKCSKEKFSFYCSGSPLFVKLCNLRQRYRIIKGEDSETKTGRPTNAERYKKHKNLKRFERNKEKFQVSPFPSSEKTIQIRIMKYLKTVKGLWVKKISDKFVKGIPDIIGCYEGKFIAFEVKKLGAVLTAYQKLEISKIKKANGQAMMVNNLQQVKDFFMEKR